MRSTTLIVLVISLLPVPAMAQAQPSFIKDHVATFAHKVGVHANASFRKPADADVTKGITFGGSMGLAPGHTNGWRFPIGIAMYGEYLHAPSGRQFGVFRTRAVMAGIGYGWHSGRWSTGASVQTGFGVNRAIARGDAAEAFGAADGLVFVQVHNAMLFRPQLKAEYSISQRFTLRMSADYMLTRPDIAVITSAGSIDDRWDVSNLHANIGIGVYPFRK